MMLGAVLMILLTGCNKKGEMSLSLFSSESVLLANNDTPYHSKSYGQQNTNSVTLQIKAFAGDVATLTLLKIKDTEGNLLLEKFLANTHCCSLKFNAPSGIEEVVVEYGQKVVKTIALSKGKGTFDLTPYRS